MSEPEDRRRAITFLPWLDPGDEAVSFGQIKVARWSVVEPSLTAPERMTVAALVGSYRTLSDKPIDVGSPGSLTGLHLLSWKERTTT
jgi:hypothetical protein